MSSISTATATTITAPPDSLATCGSRAQYELPSKDAACGVPNKEEYRSIFDECAQPADVRLYYNGCALWSLAVDQSVEKLTKCLYDNGVEWQDVWCYGLTNATATATTYPLPAITGYSSDTSDDAFKTLGKMSTSEIKSAEGKVPAPDGRSDKDCAGVVRSYLEWCLDFGLEAEIRGDYDGGMLQSLWSVILYNTNSFNVYLNCKTFVYYIFVFYTPWPRNFKGRNCQDSTTNCAADTSQIWILLLIGLILGEVLILARPF